ncbi:MAG: glycoside hydrolase family 43 protein [Flavisolibacter sp.]|nr:glycoside hydrolase family 43 protein [Flavisolibacter sp.]
MDWKAFIALNGAKSCFIVYFLIVTTAGFPQHSSPTFTNPLLPSGADPWVIQKNGYYYYMHTTGRDLVLWKTKSIADLKSAERKTVWTPPDSTMYSKQIWAPEIHFINGVWYIYFAADDGRNENHRLYVIQNTSSDPMQGEWIFKGKIADPSDKWAIDGSVFKFKRQWYIIWSGWQRDENGQQDLYIAKLKDPFTIDGDRVRISSPQLDWERHGALHDSVNPPYVYVNEGPQFLRRKRKAFIIYSASGCWTDYYALGMLTFRGRRNLLDSAKWEKSREPVFAASPENGVYAPGHNSFFKSANGREYWIIYHANAAPGQGCGRNRSPRAQKFNWKRDGTPNFGTPVKAGIPLSAPSNKE